MPERDANDPSSVPPHTPRVSGEVPARLELVDSSASGSISTSTPLPESSLRAAPAASEPPIPSEPSDTLLSAGKPADRFEIMLEDRLALVDERLREVDARLSLLEQRRSVRAPEPRAKPWLWLVFLLALVVVFQLLRRMR
jgi:hypothetical protein